MGLGHVREPHARPHVHGVEHFHVLYPPQRPNHAPLYAETASPSPACTCLARPAQGADAVALGAETDRSAILTLPVHRTYGVRRMYSHLCNASVRNLAPVL